MNTHNIYTSYLLICWCHCPELLDDVEKVTDKFHNAFTYFRLCHDIYDKKKLEEKDVHLVGKCILLKTLTTDCMPFLHSFVSSSTPDQNIKTFAEFYRENFPHAMVLPKMHFFEEHVVPLYETVEGWIWINGGAGCWKHPYVFQLIK